MKSLAVRNNNPLNIRYGVPYEGVTGEDSKGFCVFESPVWGFRAAFRNYITKFDRGVDTIAKLINEWAPPSENDTAAYIKAVCSSSGYGADEKIPLKTWDCAKKICYAQAVVESGQSFESVWTQTQMSEGAFRAGIVDAPAPLAKKVGSTIASSASGVAAAAATVQTAVENASATPHSPNIAIALVAAAAVLAFIGAILRARTHTEG